MPHQGTQTHEHGAGLVTSQADQSPTATWAGPEVGDTFVP